MEGRPLDDRDAARHSEAELIARVRRGDIAAFEVIVRQHQVMAFRVAYTILGSDADAEDATQDGFVRAYRALGSFRDGAPLRPWLLTIVANVARTRRTSAIRHPTLGLEAVGSSAPDDTALSPEAEALATEQRRELLRAIATLRGDDQRVIACRYFLDLSESETAAVLGCARGTVKSRLSRALGRLRRQLTGAAPSSAAGDSHG